MKRASAAAIILLLPVAASAVGAQSRAACDAAGARFAVGKAWSESLAERALQAASARILRKIEPGRAYTMEFSPDRLNLEVARRGVIVSARCG